MKDLKRVFMLLILGTMFSSLTSTASTLSQPGASVSFQTFYDELSPYGQWINYQDYGRVWIPDVEEGFQPYGTRGHWVVTEYGNTWGCCVLPSPYIRRIRTVAVSGSRTGSGRPCVIPVTIVVGRAVIVVITVTLPIVSSGTSNSVASAIIVSAV